MAKYLSWAVHQGSQVVPFPVRQTHVLAMTGHLHALQVNHQPTGMKDVPAFACGRIGVGSSVQDGTHSGEQLIQSERLDYVIVGTQI